MTSGLKTVFTALIIIPENQNLGMNTAMRFTIAIQSTKGLPIL